MMLGLEPTESAKEYMDAMMKHLPHAKAKWDGQWGAFIVRFDIRYDMLISGELCERSYVPPVSMAREHADKVAAQLFR